VVLQLLLVFTIEIFFIENVNVKMQRTTIIVEHFMVLLVDPADRKCSVPASLGVVVP